MRERSARWDSCGAPEVPVPAARAGHTRRERRRHAATGSDFLCVGLGYDKYEDLTTEYAVRGEFADYGVRIDKQLMKRAAQKLNARHLRQVETYAVKEGLEWIILTNGQTWQAYHVAVAPGQQVATHLALEVDLLDDIPTAKKLEKLFYLTGRR